MGVNTINNKNMNVRSVFIGDSIIERIYCGDQLVYLKDSVIFKFPLVFQPFMSFGEYPQGEHMYPLVFFNDIKF